jgi:hypothetical protein
VRKICPHEESCDSASKDIKISKASWRWDSCRKNARELEMSKSLVHEFIEAIKDPAETRKGEKE